MASRTHVLWTLAACVWAAAAAHGLEVDFQAWVDRTRLTQSESLQLTLSIRTDERVSHMPAPQIDLDDFDVQGPATSTRTNVSIVNFKQSVTHTREFVYTLYPKRTGKLLVGPARLRLDGAEYRTKALAVEVARKGTTAQSHEQTDGSGSTSVEENVFVRARASRQQAYIGQQVTIEYDICFRLRLDNVGFKEIPSFPNFWIQELFVAKSLQSQRQVIGGVSYNVAPLRRLALFPTRAGLQVIEPLVISCEIPTRSGPRGSLLDGFLDDPFFGRAARTVLVRSDSIQVDVRPLPDQGRPAGFSGAVGDFSMEVHAEPTEVPVGDPVSLRVTIQGEGNIEAVRAPEISFPSGIRVYDPEVTTEDRVRGNTVGGVRTYDYILIPEITGQLTIDPLKFAFFDPDSARYRVLSSSSLQLSSQPGSVAADSARSGLGLRRRDIEALGSDIRYIKSDASELGNGFDLYASPVFWALQALLPVCFVGLVLYQRHQQRLQGDVAYARRRRARGEMGRRLKQAGACAAAGDSAGFHAEIQRAVLAYVGDRLGLAAAGLTHDRCVQVLQEHGVPPEVSEEVRDLLVHCDFARFASAAADASQMKATRRRTERLLGWLGKLI